MKTKNASTQRPRAAVVAAAAVIAGLVLAPAFGQNPAPVTIEVSRCVDLQSPEERLACFEREVAAAQRRAPAAEPPARAAEPAPPPAVPAARPEPAPPAVPARAEPVRPAAAPPPPTVDDRREARHAARAAEERRRDRPTTEITATVTALRETVPNSLLITLDNGQVWRQTQPEPYPLRVGHDVRLYSTAWGGSFRLTAPDLHGYIQVERVR